MLAAYVLPPFNCILQMSMESPLTWWAVANNHYKMHCKPSEPCCLSLSGHHQRTNPLVCFKSCRFVFDDSVCCSLFCLHPSHGMSVCARLFPGMCLCVHWYALSKIFHR